MIMLSSRVSIFNIVAHRHIREHFDKNRNEQDPKKIEDMIKVATQAEVIIRRNVVQAWRKPEEPSTYGRFP
jgi:hypothetical protein